MNPSKNEFIVLAIVAALILLLVSRNGRTERPTPDVRSGRESQSCHTPKRIGVCPCTVNCSGREAGYAWAEEQHIDDGNACDNAGQYSNSPSFAEGCYAYVN